jgi:hypothetical protein
MPEPNPGRVPAGWAVVYLCTLVLIAILLQAASASQNPSTTAPPSSAGTSPDWGLGEGLVTVMMAQNVSGTPYWQQDCVPPQSTSFCTDPEGVAYIPGQNLVIMTEQTGGPTGGEDGYFFFNPSTLAASTVTVLGCAPEIPFYPGFGSNVYVPCLNPDSYTSGPLLVIDDDTGSIVKNVSLPFRADSMALDPDNGLIYISGGADTLAAISPSNNSVVGLTTVTGADFSDDPEALGYELVFDTATDQLIAPAKNGSLAEINPATGVAEGSLPFGAVSAALAIDPSSSRLFVSTWNAPSVFVYNAKTYQFETSMTFPNCLGYVCDSAQVNQILIDSAHGDAYLVTTGWLYSLNLSTLAVVGEIQDYGDGPQLSSVYVPLDDRIFGTYADGIVGPGFMIQLGHTDTPVVTELLWLPVLPGSLALAAVIGSATTTVSLLLPRYRKRTQIASRRA